MCLTCSSPYQMHLSYVLSAGPDMSVCATPSCNRPMGLIMWRAVDLESISAATQYISVSDAIIKKRMITHISSWSL